MSGITYPPEMLPRPDPDEEAEVIIEELVSLRAENERLRKLVRSAYNEGFGEGMDEVIRRRGGKPWQESRSRAALEALALTSPEGRPHD